MTSEMISILVGDGKNLGWSRNRKLNVSEYIIIIKHVGRISFINLILAETNVRKRIRCIWQHILNAISKSDKLPEQGERKLVLT